MNRDVASTVEATNALAIDLYRRLAAAEEGNIFFSPSSISTALAMTYAGARGKTESEMARVLHFLVPQDRLHHGFKHLIRRIGDTDCEVRVANRLWGQSGYPFLSEFLSLTRDCYGAEMATADFGKHPQQAELAINSWVADQTEDKIQDLVSATMFDRFTRLVLVSAIYFKGAWTYPFEKGETKDARFYVTAEETVEVAMMEQTTLLGYAETTEAQMLVMPYGSGDFAMLILLPRSKNGLSQLEQTLVLDDFGQYGQFEVRQVSLFLPRFKLEYGIPLDDILREMGMATAFSDSEADFSGMHGNTDFLYIAAAVHKAVVDVDEEGTEAAAATAVVMGGRGAQPEEMRTAVFRADHPFLFAIRHNATGCILFLGRVKSPQS